MATIFTRIIEGDLPGTFVWRDDRCVGFLSINPLKPGHTLVVPRRHVDSLLDGEPAMAEIGPCVDATARLLVDRLDADGLNVVSSAGAAAGQEVFHLHVHLLPRYADAPGLANLLGARAPSSEADLDAVHTALTGRR